MQQQDILYRHVMSCSIPMVIKDVTMHTREKASLWNSCVTACQECEKEGGHVCKAMISIDLKSCALKTIQKT